MNRRQLIAVLDQYNSSYPEEFLFVSHFKELLNHPRCYFRDHLPGHITGSAWIVNPEFTKVVMVHHAKLNRWLQPGGHADGDENVWQVALREAVEETGLHPVAQDKWKPFDIDIHLIPARSDFPEHYHYDVRFLFIANENDPLRINVESNDLKWIEFADLKSYTQESSIVRMMEKSRSKITSS